MKVRSLVVVLSTSLPCLAQTTWFVNAAGGGNFTAIQPAITAASPGDRIVVQGAGPYAAFVLDKGLDVEATAGAACVTIEVVGVPAGQSARVARFGVIQDNNGYVSVRNCSGAVLLSALALAGTSWQVSVGNPGLQVLASTSVFVDRGQFLGHGGTIGGAGVAVDNSNVVLAGTSVTGGVHVPTFPGAGNSGVAGVLVTNGGHATLRGASCVGGYASGGWLAGGDGGDGVNVVGGLALVLGSCSLTGLPGGGAGMYHVGQPGDAARGNVRYTADTVLVGAATTATMIANRAVLALAPSTPVGTSLGLSVTGAANLLVFVGLDLAHQYVPLPQFDGALVLTAGTPVFGLIALDASGSGSFALGIPNVPAATNQNVFAQGIADVGGSLLLTAPAVSRTQ